MLTSYGELVGDLKLTVVSNRKFCIDDPAIPLTITPGLRFFNWLTRRKDFILGALDGAK